MVVQVRQQNGLTWIGNFGFDKKWVIKDTKDRKISNNKPGHTSTRTKGTTKPTVSRKKEIRSELMTKRLKKFKGSINRGAGSLKR